MWTCGSYHIEKGTGLSMKETSDVSLHARLPKYNNRRIAAVRDFPPGCGPRKLVASNFTTETLNGGNEHGHAEESTRVSQSTIASDMIERNSNLETGSGSSKGYSRTDGVMLEAVNMSEKVDVPGPDGGLISASGLKLPAWDDGCSSARKGNDLYKTRAGSFLPLRRVSAIRDFPPYCGKKTQSTSPSQRKHSEVLDSSKSRSLGQETVDNVKKKMKETVQINMMGIKKDIGKEDVDVSLLEDQLQGQNSKVLKFDSERRVVTGLMAAPLCPWSNQGKEVSAANLLRGKIKSIGRKHHPLLVERLKSDVNPIKVNTVKSGGRLGTYGSSFTGNSSRVNINTSLPPSRPISSSTTNRNADEGVARNKVMEALRRFQDVYRELTQEAEAEGKKREAGNRRIDFKAAKVLKTEGGYVNTGKQILGPVPGVKVGDQFQYRIELNFIGLHRPLQAGIDSLKQNGTALAVSVVASGGYDNELDSDVLIYTGSGGLDGDKKSVDQKLERGNLALANSKTAQNPVRVIRGEDSDAQGRIYVYDGLYVVEDCWEDTTPQGKKVFKYKLVRMPGQPRS